MSDSLQPHGLYSPWNFQDRILEWVAFSFSRGDEMQLLEREEVTYELLKIAKCFVMR